MANRFRGTTCQYKLCGLCWFRDDAENGMKKDVPCCVAATASPLGSCPEVQIVERNQGMVLALQTFIENIKVVPQSKCSNAPPTEMRRTSQPCVDPFGVCVQDSFSRVVQPTVPLVHLHARLVPVKRLRVPVCSVSLFAF